MRGILTITLSFFLLASYGQYDPATLSRTLTAASKSDLDKVKAIFHWITGHISYAVGPWQKGGVAGWIEPEEDGPLKPLNERVAMQVLRRGTAHCDGYARLFKTLCDYAGIPAEIIQGYARNAWNRPGSRFGVNHYWNAVYLDGKWQLLDATWASGYVNWKGDQFTMDYDGNYFLAEPETFIRDHYPDDARWTLLPDSKIPDEFRNSPFKQKAFGKYRFNSFYPSTGIIEANVGDTVVLRLETAADATLISPTMAVDSTLFSYSPTWVFLKPDQVASMGAWVSRYTYPVNSAEVQWLYLLYNNDIVLKYKINIRKPKS